jgi:hypothetical protein
MREDEKEECGVKAEKYHEVFNGIITKADVGYEDHGIMTVFLAFEHKGGHQGIGRYSMDSFSKVGINFVQRILDTVGVLQLSHLHGEPVRIALSKGGITQAIGHIYKDRWFEPQDEYATARELKDRLLEGFE